MTIKKQIQQVKTFLENKYGLKPDTTIPDLQNIMSPMDYKLYSDCIAYPKGKPSENVKNVPDHLRKVSNENLDNLRYLFRNTNFTKEQD
tara:strand:+ start:277 stop:543 length:267 start_codon:yes stop_codon:yes gene_type:complete